MKLSSLTSKIMAKFKAKFSKDELRLAGMTFEDAKTSSFKAITAALDRHDFDHPDVMSRNTVVHIRQILSSNDQNLSYSELAKQALKEMRKWGLLEDSALRYAAKEFAKDWQVIDSRKVGYMGPTDYDIQKLQNEINEIVTQLTGRENQNGASTKVEHTTMESNQSVKFAKTIVEDQTAIVKELESLQSRRILSKQSDKVDLATRIETEKTKLNHYKVLEATLVKVKGKSPSEILASVTTLVKDKIALEITQPLLRRWESNVKEVKADPTQVMRKGPNNTAG